ncbi:MAG: recombinase zinc beta ribbon domain-containing protein, partial [Emcibacteraceae bacterium]|nr:recombinase zinc beta ribbon domain-containing protein [Emcibacteraceae bacterium]
RAKYIRKIFHDFSQGKYTTYQAIKDSDEAKLLINPKSNTSYVLKVCDIKKMLKNKIYIGKIELKKWGVEETDGVHEAIIDERTFYKVQDQLNQKGVKKHNKIRSEEFPLKGDLICGNCKTTLVYNKTKGRNKKYPYYRCNGTRDICDTSPKSIQTDKVHDDFLNLLSGASIHPKVLKLADRVIEDIYKDKSDHLKGIRQTKRARINELVKARDRHIKTLINSENEHVKKALEDEINKIDKEISALESQKENTEHLESFKLEGIKLLENPKECWLEANYQERKLIFDFVFDQPLEITKGKIGTAPYALPYSLLASKEIQKEGMVELSGLEPLTSTLPV